MTKIEQINNYILLILERVIQKPIPINRIYYKLEKRDGINNTTNLFWSYFVLILLRFACASYICDKESCDRKFLSRRPKYRRNLQIDRERSWLISLLIAKVSDTNGNRNSRNYHSIRNLHRQFSKTFEQRCKFRLTGRKKRNPRKKTTLAQARYYCRAYIVGWSWRHELAKLQLIAGLSRVRSERF